jgi:sugar phosphate isomerase/epimerase
MSIDWVSILVPIVTGLTGWFLSELKNYREKKSLKMQVKAQLLDKILEQCRKLEKHLKSFVGNITSYKDYLQLGQEIEPELGFPKNAFDFQSEPNFLKYIESIKDENERLQHFHQDYMVKTKSEKVNIIDSIYKEIYDLTTIHHQENWDVNDARKSYKAVQTDLRLVHHYIKEVYPNHIQPPN